MAMRKMAPLLLAMVLTAGMAGARAESALPDEERGRYTFNQVADGVLRLDTRTGAVSLCRRKEAGWVCETVADDRKTLESEITRLQAENGALKRELVARGAPLPGIGDRSSSERQSEWRLPSDADLDRVMSFLEKMWRRLIEMVQRVQKDAERKG